LPAPATREDVEVQRAGRILTNVPGDVSSAWHHLLGIITIPPLYKDLGMVMIGFALKVFDG
jgi:hypothetical protein